MADASRAIGRIGDSVPDLARWPQCYPPTKPAPEALPMFSQILSLHCRENRTILLCRPRSPLSSLWLMDSAGLNCRHGPDTRVS